MNIIIERGRTWDFSELAPKTIALDGAVQGPQIDGGLERYSFDHHAGCLRLVTKATCAQVLDALVLGLNPSGFNVLVNDVDGDTVLSVWLLQNSEMVLSPFVQNLVTIVGNIDAHGPAYRLTEAQAEVSRKFYQGVMYPEKFSRLVAKNYGQLDLGDLLAQCLSELDNLVSDPDGYTVQNSLPDQTVTFEVTHKDENFVMVTSDGWAFAECYSQGLNAVVLYSTMPDGSIAYTIGKKNEFISGFNIPEILKLLCEYEPGWGGGSTIGGAPRNPDGSRSRLTPDKVFWIITGYLAYRKINP